jgi:hypothetical protein
MPLLLLGAKHTGPLISKSFSTEEKWARTSHLYTHACVHTHTHTHTHTHHTHTTHWSEKVSKSLLLWEPGLWLFRVQMIPGLNM